MVMGIGCCEICHLHINNGIFNAEIFVEDCNNNFQAQP